MPTVTRWHSICCRRAGNRRGEAGYHRYLPQASRQLHNAGMGLLFAGFLQRIAVGAGAVFGLLLLVRLSMPRRSVIVASRRTMQ